MWEADGGVMSEMMTRRSAVGELSPSLLFPRCFKSLQQLNIVILSLSTKFIWCNS